MNTPIGSICRAATHRERLNILTFPTHERYETGLCQTGHNFYAWRGQNIKDWNENYAPCPDNYSLLKHQSIPIDLEFDLILSQNKFGQFPIAVKLAKDFHLPLVTLEHTLPMPNWGNQLIEFQKMKGDIDIFISDYSRQQWGWNNTARIIHHGIDTELFSPSDNIDQKLHVLSVVNDFVNRDYCCGYTLWSNVTAGLPTKLLGDTPGLSQPAKSTTDLVNAYRSARVFLNTSLISPVPTVMLEAMSCGCAIVSTSNCMIPEVITNGVNGFICDNVDDMRRCISKLLEDEKLSRELGVAARQTIVEKFNLNNFVKNWSDVFREAASIIFTGERYEN